MQTGKPNQEMTLFDSLCAASSLQLNADVATPLTLDHHLYHHLRAQWIKKPLQEHPYIKLLKLLTHLDYPRLRYNSQTPTPRVHIIAIEDTVCQSCLMGVRLLKKLGLKYWNLIPVKMRMHTANNNQITILVAAILNIVGKYQGRIQHTTKQIVYVTDKSDKFYLSFQACADLGMMSPTFPTIGETTPPHTTTSGKSNRLNMDNSIDSQSNSTYINPA